MFDVNLETLRTNLLGSTPIYFDYRKNNGETVNALGTLNEKLIPKEFKPKDASSNYPPPKNFRYFDIKKHGWRSMSEDVKLVSMLE